MKTLKNYWKYIALMVPRFSIMNKNESKRSDRNKVIVGMKIHILINFIQLLLSVMKFYNHKDFYYSVIQTKVDNKYSL